MPVFLPTRLAETSEFPRRGRVTYRSLKLRYQFDDGLLAGVTDELISAERVAGDTPQDKVRKLEQTLTCYRFPQGDTVPLLAELLSLQCQKGSPHFL